MDEPTSSLTRADAAELFAVISRLRSRGVSIVYISHFLEECRDVADRFTVLRDGLTVGSGKMGETDEGNLVRMMVGREINEIYPRRKHEIGSEILRVRSLEGRGKRPDSVNLTLREGEILGVAGLVGAGRTEMLRTLFGLDEALGGQVFVLGRESSDATPRRRLHEGVGFLSENRKEEGLMLNQSIADNLSLSRMENMRRFGLLDLARQRSDTVEWMGRLRVRAEGPSQPMTQLSGGNQQKVALGRLLYHDARVLLLDEPTRGVDVGSKAEMYRIMLDLAASGKGIVFVSSYLPELMGICDTIAVMSRGRLVAARPARDWTEEEVLAAAIGADVREEPEEKGDSHA
jgi:ribose transport system ATP-binding protein